MFSTPKVKPDMYKMLKTSKAMAVYGDNDLQQHKLEPQLSLPPEMMQADTSRFDIADLLDCFQSLGNARKLLSSTICTVTKPILVTPATNANHKRDQVQPPLASACPKGIG